jgi:hypothetical protein
MFYRSLRSAGSLHMGLVVNEVAMEQGFLRALTFSLLISQPVLCVFFNGFEAVVPELHVTLPEE